MVDPHAELLANLRLAASFAARAADQQGAVAAALVALHRRCAGLAVAVERGEPADPGAVWGSLGAVEALVAALRGSLDGVSDHLGQVVLRVESG